MSRAVEMTLCAVAAIISVSPPPQRVMQAKLYRKSRDPVPGRPRKRRSRPPLLATARWERERRRQGKPAHQAGEDKERQRYRTRLDAGAGGATREDLDVERRCWNSTSWPT